jgi:hypothetical protein
MNTSQSNADLLESSMKKGKKKRKAWQSTDAKVDPGFMRDMGYGSKSSSSKKKKKAY